MAVADKLNELVIQRNNLADNLNTMGVSAAQDETFTSLVPKVLDIETGITPTGTIDITENGTYDVTDKASANVNVNSADVSEYFENTLQIGSTSGSALNRIIKKVPPLSISRPNSNYLFYNCTSLETIPLIDMSISVNVQNDFYNCSALTNFGGFKNLGQNYSTTQSANYYEYKLDLSSCTKLTHDSLMNVINNLYDIAAKGCNTQQVVMGSTNLAKLTAEEIAIGTSKGWSIS